MEKIAIVDFGGQYTHLIARRVRELGVFSQIYQPDNFTISENIKGIVFSGGPQSVDREDAYKIDLDLKKIKIPILGICYGHQLIAYMEGGKIKSGKTEEYGFTKISVDNKSEIFSNIKSQQIVWMSHKDFVSEISKDYIITASSNNFPVIAFEHKYKKIYGVQFHPEVTHTINGLTIIDNFLKVCNVKREWNADYYQKEIFNEISGISKDKNLLILLSGGVDSLVAFEASIKALGRKRVFALHIDTGFMRKGESKNILDHLKKIGYENLKLIKAENLFFKKLKGVTEPEKKREIVGKLFVDVINKYVKDFNKENWLLVQGTIYPDTIESGYTKNSAKIKTHHNRVKEIEKMIKEGRVIEPLKNLYKDEVRKLGFKLGLPKELINRQPFPGPGLAIRILCSNGIKDKNFDSEKSNISTILKDYNMDFAILPIKSVGVQGDFRTYKHPLAVRFKEDNLFEWEVLRHLSTQILNKSKTINRVVYSFENLKDIKLIELYLTKSNVRKLQEIDDFIRRKIENKKGIWQMPIVELPLIKDERQFFLIRPVQSVDAMSADFYRFELKTILEINEELKRKYDIAGLFYDITTKPPATIEWE